jgi:hypothetical protein
MLANTILNKYFSLSEVRDITQLLVKYRKSGIGWDEWRKKHFPDALSINWGKCLNECYKNGFIGPYVYADEIKFYQVLGRPHKMVDECTMCPADFDKGECKHTIVNGNFTPCWLEPAPF